MQAEATRIWRHEGVSLMWDSDSAADGAVTAGVARNGAWSLAQRRDHAFGLVLGRGLARDIGHYLLGTAEQAHRGLMRASFSSRDLVGPRAAKSFLLDDRSAELLSARLDAGVSTPTAATHRTLPEARAHATGYRRSARTPTAAIAPERMRIPAIARSTRVADASSGSSWNVNLGTSE